MAKGVAAAARPISDHDITDVPWLPTAPTCQPGRSRQTPFSVRCGKKRRGSSDDPQGRRVSNNPPRWWVHANRDGNIVKPAQTVIRPRTEPAGLALGTCASRSFAGRAVLKKGDLARGRNPSSSRYVTGGEPQFPTGLATTPSRWERVARKGPDPQSDLRTRDARRGDRAGQVPRQRGARGSACTRRVVTRPSGCPRQSRAGYSG